MPRDGDNHVGMPNGFLGPFCRFIVRDQEQIVVRRFERIEARGDLGVIGRAHGELLARGWS